MARERSQTLTARELKPRIQRLSWERLTEIYLTTKSQAVRRMVDAEARRCGYKMSGFILAQGLRRMVEAGDPK
ncbi:MAG: hypothetical protein FJ290_25080 [Planctomycetes bacterium]|nr:hypothetical protein [Planctomycetota bacterium]